MVELFKKRNETRTPVPRRSLSHPGESLQEQRQLLFFDMFAWALFPIVMGVFALTEWLRYALNQPPTPVAWTVLFVASLVVCSWRLLRLYRLLDPLHLAIRGERTVGQMLDGLRAKGYQVFHDLAEDGFNIDHVLVGPAGIFAVETKTRSKPARGQDRIVYDGENITLPGKVADPAPIIQAKASARRVREILHEMTGREVRVRAAVIYPGWFVTGTVPEPEVTVANDKYFSKSFEPHHSNGPRVLSPNDIAFFSAALDRYVREKQ